MKSAIDMSEITTRNLPASARSKRVISECKKAKLSDTQRNASISCAQETSFPREPEICEANFSVHAQKPLGFDKPIQKSNEIYKAETKKQEENEEIIVEEEIVDYPEIQEVQENIAETKEQQDEYIYVYGITNNVDVKFNIEGLKNTPIKKISFMDISALTSSYPVLLPVINENEAMQHSDILKKISEETTVIPMSFGTVFKDQNILETILSKSYKAIKETLILIDGKIELGVKVIKNPLDYIHDKITFEILASLDQLSVKSIKGEIFSERLLLNHSFLVERNKFSKFSDKIAELERRYKHLTFIYTGPWPPYSFVNIKIAGS